MFGLVRISFCAFFFYPVFTAFVGHLPFICGTLARLASNASVAREPHKCLSRAVLVSLASRTCVSREPYLCLSRAEKYVLSDAADRHRRRRTRCIGQPLFRFLYCVGGSPICLKKTLEKWYWS